MSGAAHAEVHPLTADRWDDLEALFGRGGAWGGCWCMWFRMRSSESQRSTSRANKAGLKALAESDQAPGLLAYVDGRVAGWVSVDARERYPRLLHSRNPAPLEGENVWSIVCFVIGKDFRRRGLMTRLIDAACAYATDHGARSLEAYPLTAADELTGFDGFTGIASAFRRAGFEEVRPVGKRQVLMRKRLK